LRRAKGATSLTAWGNAREIAHHKSLALKARFIAVIGQFETDEDDSLF
jgi:hypothetical protein